MALAGGVFLGGRVAPAAAQGSAPGGMSAFDSAKVASLLASRLPCLGCHVVGGRGGAIGPDLTHVAARRPAAYIAAIIADPQRVVPGTLMPRTPMPAGMRALVTSYLAGSPLVASAGAHVDPLPPTTRGGATASGAALYARHCAACHGERGGGDGPNASRLPVQPARHADAALMSGKSDARLFDAIAGGGYPMGGSAMMPAFGETLDREQIRSLVAHLRVLCRCESPAWSRTGGGAPGVRR